MKSIFQTIAGGVITLIIGGTAYTISHSDIVNNFANNTGLTQEQAEEYVNSITEDDFISFDKLGSDFIEEGNDVVDAASQIDCINYQYEWEKRTLTCEQGKSQLAEVGKDEIALGNAYKTLSQDDADRLDISATIPLIDELSSDFEFPIVNEILDPNTVDELKKTNAFNKSLLQAALSSENN